MDAAGDDDLALVNACLEIEDELRQRVEAAIGEPVRYTVATFGGDEEDVAFPKQDSVLFHD